MGVDEGFEVVEAADEDTEGVSLWVRLEGVG